MLNIEFEIDGWFPDDFPDVDLGETFFAMSTERSMLDENLNLVDGLVVLGIYNLQGKLVGYVPNSLQQTAKEALPDDLQFEVVAPHDDEFHFLPVVRMTDSEFRSTAH